MFNSSGWTRSSYARVSAIDPAKSHFETADGKAIASQVIGNESIVAIESVAPVSLASIRVAAGAASGQSASASPFKTGAASVESPFVAIEWNDKGQLVKFFDKKLGRNVLAGAANVLEIFEDKPRQYDAWELEAAIDLKKEIIDRFRGRRGYFGRPLLRPDQVRLGL